MPKVGKLEFKIKNEKREFPLWYDQSDGFHLKNFPKEILEVTASNLAGASTELILKNSIQEIIDQYHKIISKTSRHILIEIHGTAESVMNHVGDRSFSGRKSGVPDWFTSNLREGGHGFVISWTLMLKVFSKDVKYFEVLEDWTPERECKVSYREEHIIIDWTEERELFLKQVDVNIDAMILKVAGFFGNKEQLLGYIDSGKKLLS